MTALDAVKAHPVPLMIHAMGASDIVSKIKARLSAGKNVTITSGLLSALQGKGIEDITELQYTDKKVA